MEIRMFRRLRAVSILLVGVLAAVIITGSATTRTTYIITDGDVITTVEGYAGEVDAALRRAGIQPGEDGLEVSGRTGGVVEVDVQRTVTTYERVVEEVLPQTVIHREDPDAPVGEQRVAQEGSDGQVVRTVEVVTGSDGTVQRNDLGVETTPAVDKIIFFGTKIPG